MALNLSGVADLHNLLPQTSHDLLTLSGGRETSKDKFHLLAWIGVESIKLSTPSVKISCNTLVGGSIGSCYLKAVGRILKTDLPASLGFMALTTAVSILDILGTIGGIFLDLGLEWTFQKPLWVLLPQSLPQKFHFSLWSKPWDLDYCPPFLPWQFYVDA